MVVGLVAGMVNTRNFFDPLVRELEGRATEVSVYLQGTELAVLDGPAREKLAVADFILSGITAPDKHADLERAVIELAREKGIRYGFLADASGAYRRPWIETYRSDASALGVRFPWEVAPAQKLFPTATVAVVGHPTAEASPKFSRSEVRKRLGLSESDVAIYLGGGKSLGSNREIISLVHEGVSGTGARFLFGPHPGVTGKKAGANEIPLDAYREFSVLVEVVDPALGSSDDLMVGMDAFCFTSGTAFYTAVYHGVAALLLNTPGIAARRDTDLSVECATGAILPVSNAEALHWAVAMIKTGALPALFEANRPVYWPKPVPGAAVTALADLVLSVCSCSGTKEVINEQFP